jgi:hypothetical protein
MPRPTLSLLFLFLVSAVPAQDTTWTARVVTSVTTSEAPAWRTWRGSFCSLNYPGAWAVDPSGTNGGVVAFLAPLDSSIGYRENVVVRSAETAGDMTASAQANTLQLKNEVNDLNILTDNIKGNEQMLEYTGKLDGRDLAFKRMAVLHEGRWVTLTYSAPAASYEEKLFLADAMMHSLRFLK